MRDLVLPAFPRITDYVGLWCMEPTAFQSLWLTAERIDLASHILSAGPVQRQQPAMDMVPNKGGKSTAVIRIGGTLMKSQSSLGGTSTVQIRRDVRSAASDPNVSAILLAIDSPGGAVAGTVDLAADVKAATRKKPVWAHIDDMGASAAYWLASQADVIYANSPTALVGSIGTVMTVYDESQAAEHAGVKPMVFRTGPLKGAGTPGEPISEEQASHFQRLVNETQTHFDAAVRSGRGMTAAQLAAVRSGGVFPASEALSLKLIDGVRSLDSTLAALSAAK